MSIKRPKRKIYEPSRYTLNYNMNYYKKTANWFLNKLDRDSSKLMLDLKLERENQKQSATVEDLKKK